MGSAPYAGSRKSIEIPCRTLIGRLAVSLSSDIVIAYFYSLVFQHDSLFFANVKHKNA